jgi:exodeoxyribonuclease VII large subunit
MAERRTRLVSAARALPRPDEILALVRQRLDAAASRLGQALKANTREHGARLGRISPRLGLAPLRVLIASERRSLELSGQRAARAIAGLLTLRHQRLAAVTKLADSLSYRSVLRRGFALVRDGTGQPVYAAAGVQHGQALRLEFADGEVSVREDSPEQGRLL